MGYDVLELLIIMIVESLKGTTQFKNVQNPLVVHPGGVGPLKNKIKS